MRATLGLVIGTAAGNVIALDGSAKLPPVDGSQLLNLIPTGVIWDFAGASAPSGWVLLSGRTIGDASSSATERANADCQALFTHLWNNFADAECAVSSGRGANAAADWAAHKQIALPDARGRVIAGKDDMGGSAASRLTSGGAGIDGATLGKSGGAQTVTLTTTEMPAHTHSYDKNSGTGITSGASGQGGALTTPNTGSQGSGGAHQNMPPTLVMSKIIKL